MEAQTLPSRVRRCRRLGAAAAADQPQTDGGDGEARGIERKRQPDAQERTGISTDQDARDGRADKPDQLGDAHDDRVARLQVPFFDQHGDDAVFRRDGESRHQTEPQPEGIQHPDLDGPGKDRQRHQAGQDETNEIGDEHDQARREPVRDRAADEHKHGARDAAQRQDDAQRQRVAGQLQHQPRHGDERELVPQQGGRCPGEQQPKITQRQHAQHWVLGGR